LTWARRLPPLPIESQHGLSATHDGIGLRPTDQAVRLAYQAPLPCYGGRRRPVTAANSHRADSPPELRSPFSGRQSRVRFRRKNLSRPPSARPFSSCPV